MAQASTKTLEDLEFPTVIQQAKALCKTEEGKVLADALMPIDDPELLREELQKTSEYLSSFTNENRIPGHEFESVAKAIKFLQILNSVLQLDAFGRIKSICLTVFEHQKFFKKFSDYYPTLQAQSGALETRTEIVESIDRVIDRFGEVKDDASSRLKQLRNEIAEVRSQITKSFNSALSRYLSAEYLDEIRESIQDNRRVLAVKSMYRKKVKGAILGTSKTGSITYIEPEATLRYSRELHNLEFEEEEEIQRILAELTNDIRPYTPEIQAYVHYLSKIDLTAAKATYAHKMNAILPDLNENRRLYLKDAYHPLLYLTNVRTNEKTWPQTIELHPENRIIVISGPNAGGKSITLKTIGLLQVMLQSGLLVPVHERSSFCLFEKILTDIGDHQSIENHLSTYSYRLKNMNRFLRKCNENTLFLIDEFGTGSDPELGGALAETFLEVFYERASYGVITTHYANLKVLANELPHATNANMLFNSKTLEPTYQLEMGQPGSSFTFEVAQKNGIPYSLINKAKKKIDRGKVRFDATIAKMQKERTKMAQTEDRLQEEESKAREEAMRLEKLNAKMKDKLSSYQELYDYNQRMIYLGSKVDKAAEKYFVSKKKRPLISELLRIVETENSKRKKQTAEVRKEEKTRSEKVEKEVAEEVKQIRKEKAIQKKKAEKKEVSKPKPNLKVGDRVRLEDSRSVGTIDSIEKKKAIVNYGMFTTNVSLDKLELVESYKS